jgi:CubicO group peptidase (beta-lactamase class C family)
MTGTRRTFIATSLATLATPRFLRLRLPGDDLDDFIKSQMRTARIPGLAVTVLKSGKIAWSKGYGWADIANRKPMDPDRTIQNIGSVSKTVTATAVMQLVERNQVALDEDVSRYLPFPVRHPSHPTVPITCRLLLTHRSAIVDGPAYGKSYLCGDPQVRLGAWLEDYLTPEGALYQAETNFGAWEPGTRWKYSNIGFGLLGHVVEHVSGQSFSAYTHQRILAPLGMTRTGWAWSEIDPRSHAVVYAAIGDPKDGELEQSRRSGLTEGSPEHDPDVGDFQPHCRYSFVTTPDGGLRTSANQLARFLLAYLGGGKPILEPATVRQMLTPAGTTGAESGQGLAWHRSEVGGEIRWGHGGADPGVRTQMSFRPSDGVGVIVFVNRGQVGLDPIVNRLFQVAREVDRRPA